MCVCVCGGGALLGVRRARGSEVHGRHLRGSPEGVNCKASLSAPVKGLVVCKQAGFGERFGRWQASPSVKD